MKATEAKLLEFLKKSPQCVIPIYQRTYSWTERECRQLTRHLVSLLKKRSHGSVFDTITCATLSSVKIIVPIKVVLEAFECLVSPILKRIKNNAFESRTLATLRESLLPKLISGELRVPDAERIVGRCI